MIEKAEAKGLLKNGMKVIEPTSGNTGISLAFVCATKGYPLILVMPETMSMERKILLLLLGAKLILTPGALGMRGAIAKVMELTQQNPQKYFFPQQFENEFNPEIHRETTGPEIWDDTDGQVDIVVSGIGTGGTITGSGEFLKSKNPSIKMVAVEPTDSPVLSGGKAGPHKIQGIGAGFKPRVLNMKIVDEVIQVSSDEALKVAHEVIIREGIPVGISSGAAVAAVLKLAQKSQMKGKKVVVIIPSYTERYLSTILAEKERAEAQTLPVTQVEESWLQKVDAIFED